MMAYRCCAPTSDLQDVLGEAAERLSALRMSMIARKAFVDEDDCEDLAALASLTLDIARVLDPIFHEISYRGGIGSRSRANAYAAVVTTAVEGNLDFELRDRAERIADWRGSADPDDEHRLSAAELGVGGAR
jgi:hypothetical protein